MWWWEFEGVSGVDVGVGWWWCGVSVLVGVEYGGQVGVVRVWWGSFLEGYGLGIG